MNIGQLWLAAIALLLGGLLGWPEQDTGGSRVAWEAVTISSYGGLASVPLEAGARTADQAPAAPAAPAAIECPPGYACAQPVGRILPIPPVIEFPELAYADLPVLSASQVDGVLEQAQVPAEWRPAFRSLGRCESRYRPRAVGDGGASLGWLQIQPKWHLWRLEALGYPADPELLFDPVIAAEVGAHIRETNGNYAVWTCKP